MYKILVVDDDPVEPALMRTVMQNLRHTHELTFVLGGREALAFLRGPGRGDSHPHLILLDLNMPRMDGVATLTALKADPELRVIPVIIFSSSDAPEDVRRSYAAHANCYVRKPTDLERLVKFVQDLSGRAIAPQGTDAMSHTMTVDEAIGAR